MALTGAQAVSVRSTAARHGIMKFLVVAVCALAACASAAPQFQQQEQQFKQTKQYQTQQYQTQQYQTQQYQTQQQYQRQQAYTASSAPTVNIALTRSSPEQPIVILRQVQDFSPSGTYSYSYETENAIQAAESGELKNAGTPDEANSVRGSYSWTGPDDQVYTVNYIADENGYQAQGAHLPVPPAIPEEIQRAIDYARSQPGFREEDDGQYKNE